MSKESKIESAAKKMPHDRIDHGPAGPKGKGCAVGETSLSSAVENLKAQHAHKVAHMPLHGLKGC